MSETASTASSASTGIADLGWFTARARELTAQLPGGGGAAIGVNAPWSGATLFELPQASVSDVATAAAAARAIQRPWALTSPGLRRSILFRAHDLLLERRGRIIDLLQAETGKARATAFEELFAAAAVLRYTAVTASKTLALRSRPGIVPGLMRVRVEHLPKGLISVITPWNFPLSLAAMDVVPALASGNAVLQKIDSQTPLAVLELRLALIDAGLPADLWQVVTGPGDPVGNAVVDAGDHVSFTGSTATGARIAERVAPRLVSYSLELGGKNPMIVLDDVDPHRAAWQAVAACFSSTGQLCVSIERIYVQTGVADAFLSEFVQAASELVLGGTLDYSTDLGSLTGPAQFDRVVAHIRDAVDHGAEIAYGGNPRPDLGPYFHEPTILTGVDAQMACYREETFGPVVSVHTVDSIDEAVALANDSEYGLNAAVLSGSPRRARKVAGRLEAGTVNINEGYRVTFGAFGAPQGGMKRSGLGRRNGPEGLLRYTQPRTVACPSPLVPLPDSGASAARLEPLLTGALRVLRALRLP